MKTAWWDRLTAAAKKFAKSKTGEQVARFGRLIGVGLATAYLTGNAVTTTAAVGIAEVAFRQVWPS